MPTTLHREPAVAAGESTKQNTPIGFRQGCANSGPGATPFGRQLRNLRLQNGLSQKQLARSSTLSVRAIRDLENGRVRQPRADSLRLLADALGLSAPQMNRLTNDHAPGFPAGAAGPAMSGPFIGREQEVAVLTTMLGAEHHRLVTITGIEGVGKTRLAREVARALEAAEQATVLWLPLDDPLRSGRATAGAPEPPSWLREIVHSGPDSRRRLIEAIGESNGLLVLDGAGPQDGLADITAGLVAACPRLRILVTTRNPVDMPLDSLFPLAPLPVPLSDTEPAELEQVASVALLLAQAKRIQPAFRPDPHTLADVARICRTLDGLPAALESAAHWSLIYSLRQLSHQLTTEPLTVARRPHGGRQQADAYASVQHTITTLSSRQRDLLSAMAHGTPQPAPHRASRDLDGYWSVPEVADTMGLTAAECADDIYHLLILGMLRRIDHHDVAMFSVLNIVGIAGRSAIAGQHTAA
ncbi:XRE family transcriptional regulator [Streptacidiphilus sp. PB12-B1b]|uniref:helix-turn-helix domain-containing protein n=1 Tax=Streptacidiphilus sp. PB12-B1b TaxID=2705012 RepID=UPI0015FB786D|nr:helix-turn-helix domain-containing protein [Streptacidiphilus sp. PB12-B1b]QMU79085.1 XRE family transcriptional regulator [Streptacidiphilus sp. PB12-B1b]